MTADEFNKKFSVGEEVVYVNDFGKKILSKLRTEAWTIGNGDAVVSLEGKSGGFSVYRIEKCSVPELGDE